MLSGKFWVMSTDPAQPPSMTIKNVIKRSYNKYGVFLDYDCPNGQDCIFQVSSRVCQSGHSFVKATLETDTLACFSRIKVVWLEKQTWIWIQSITHNKNYKTVTHYIKIVQNRTSAWRRWTSHCSRILLIHLFIREDCWRQLQALQDRPSYISLSTSFRGNGGYRQL